jgi:hypothetical protein
MLPDCLILSGYRTTPSANAAWLSDSSRLSDNLQALKHSITELIEKVKDSPGKMGAVLHFFHS